jgi:DNA-binding transcriptional regulator YiaG
MSLQAISFNDMILDMGRNSKKRHAASEAVIALREALNQTQQAFAHKMKTAIVTIARWETSQPPHGLTLLRLAEVAKQAWIKNTGGAGVESRLDDLHKKFFGLYMDEVISAVMTLELGSEQHKNRILTVDPKTKAGYVLAKLQGSAQLQAGAEFILTLSETTKTTG